MKRKYTEVSTKHRVLECIKQHQAQETNPFSQLDEDTQAELEENLGGIQNQAMEAKVSKIKQQQAVVEALHIFAEQVDVFKERHGKVQRTGEQIQEQTVKINDNPAETEDKYQDILETQTLDIQSANENKQRLQDKAAQVQSELSPLQQAVADLKETTLAREQELGTSAATEVQADLGKLQAMEAWYREAETLHSSISGVQLTGFSSHELTAALPNGHSLSLQFDSGTVNFRGAQLEPADVLITDIVAEGVRVNDLGFVLREAANRVVHAGIRKEHIEELRKVYHVDYSRNSVVFCLPMGVAATLLLTPDYPMARSVRIGALDGVNGWSSAQLKQVMSDINKKRFGTILQLAGALERTLASVDTTKTPRVVLRGKVK